MTFCGRPLYSKNLSLQFFHARTHSLSSLGCGKTRSSFIYSRPSRSWQTAAAATTPTRTRTTAEEESRVHRLLPQCIFCPCPCHPASAVSYLSWPAVSPSPSVATRRPRDTPNLPSRKLRPTPTLLLVKGGGNKSLFVLQAFILNTHDQLLGELNFILHARRAEKNRFVV